MLFKKDVWLTPYAMMRTLHIYVPQSIRYSDERYPVLYMYDGHNLFEDETATYGKSWGFKDYLDAHEVPLIVVGIECNHEGNSRLVEYCPYTFQDDTFGTIEGSGQQMMQWVVDELKPLIDLELPTRSDRAHTWIGGSSMGGLMALYSITHHNAVFSKAACLSPFIAPVYRELTAECQRPLQPDTSIYLSWGSSETRSKRSFAEISKVNLEIANQLQKQNIRLHLNLVVGGQHNEACWEKEIPVFLRFFKETTAM